MARARAATRSTLELLSSMGQPGGVLPKCCVRRWALTGRLNYRPLLSKYQLVTSQVHVPNTPASGSTISRATHIAPFNLDSHTGYKAPSSAKFEWSGASKTVRLLLLFTSAFLVLTFSAPAARWGGQGVDRVKDWQRSRWRERSYREGRRSLRDPLHVGALSFLGEGGGEGGLARSQLTPRPCRSISQHPQGRWRCWWH